MREAGMTTRVANEVEVHWQLRHPSILKLYNYFEDEKNVYLVMELCSKGELYRYVQKRTAQGQSLSEPETRSVVRQLVQGLLYLHSHGIIHRDLKLSNLLLTENMDVVSGPKERSGPQVQLTPRAAGSACSACSNPR